MASSFEKSVKGATKIKAAPPKTKYIEHILVATHADEAGVGEVFRALQHRLRDSTWTVVFKSLITVHLMIREGSPDVTLSYLAKHKNALSMNMISDAQTQGRNIRHYGHYLSERARAYRDTKCDWVRGKETRLEKLTIDKGLLRETEVVQYQLTALLKCDVLDNEPENEITITVFRLLVLDLLAMFQVLNQAMINILGHFFEMSKPDAQRAMGIYRNFVRQTDYVVQYLTVARQYEHHTRVGVPKLKHAPVNLGRQLEEYLKDSDFEIHRRQYLAELEAKKAKGGSGGGPPRLFNKNNPSKNETPSPATAAAPKQSSTTVNGAARQPSKPAPQTKGDLIDFFDSIEQNQTPMAVQTPVPAAAAQTGVTPWGNSPFPMQPTGQVQANGLAAQPTGFPSSSPFQPQNVGGFPQQQQQQQQQLQPNFTGVGFGGGFSSQPPFQLSSLAPAPQNTAAPFQTSAPTGFLQSMPTGQQSTNPFRQSSIATGQGSASLYSPSPPAQQRPLTSQSTNPFARSSPQAAQPFAAPGSSGSPFPSQTPPPLQPAQTGTNPFAKGFGAAGASSAAQSQHLQRPVTAGASLSPQPTGTTNPFRQSAFYNHSTGMGWQHNQQAMGGGLDQLESMPVFPRPAQQTPWQQ